MNKKGISLVILVITILVMIVLASVIVTVSSDAFNNSKKAAFAMDLEQVEQLVEEYYLNNNELPINIEDEYDKSTLVGLALEGAEFLSEEINLNGDDDETFYKIDMSKLPIEETLRGLDEDEADIFVITNTSYNVYYVRGERIGDVYYFSLTEELTGKSKLNDEVALDDSNVSITGSTGVIKLTKNTKDWTNDLTVTVDATLESGETLKYYIAGEDVSSSVSENTIDVDEILNANNTLKTTFYSNDANKVVTVQKILSNEVIAETAINVSNLDILSGDVSSLNVTNTVYANFVLSKITGYTDLGGSSVKEARVLYTGTLDDDGNIVPYYTDTPSTITKEYINSVGVKNSATAIKLPKDVSEYMVVFIDNAGNISEPVKCTVE